MRNKEKISIPLHCVGGQAALPSEQRKPKGSACLVVRSKDQSQTLIKLYWNLSWCSCCGATSHATASPPSLTEKWDNLELNGKLMNTCFRFQLACWFTGLEVENDGHFQIKPITSANLQPLSSKSSWELSASLSYHAEWAFWNGFSVTGKMSLPNRLLCS